MQKPLNTADHFTLMMDHEIRRSGLAGNFCAIVYELDVQPDADFLQLRSSEFIRRFPGANVRLKRSGRRYFWVTNQDQDAQALVHRKIEDRSAALKTIEEIMNAPSSAESTAPVLFYLLDTPACSFFMLRWFHPICDAKGAELILHQMLEGKPDQGIEEGEDAFSQMVAKWGLWQKFNMIRKAKRHVDALDSLSSSLPLIKDAQADKLGFQIVRLDAVTSKQILAQARKEAGMTGTALYFIGCLMRAMCSSGCDEQEGFCVPYAMNMRKRKALFPLFGNQVSFLFAQADMDQVRDRRKLFSSLREQHKTTIRSGLDQALVPLMQAGSWLPLDKFGKIIRNAPNGRERSSFWFSYTGEPDPKVAEVAGSRIRSMFQLSQVTSPPSLGLLVSQYNGEITLSFNYISSQIDGQWLISLTHALTAELQGGTAT